jgi:hypothetical protein
MRKFLILLVVFAVIGGFAFADGATPAPSLVWTLGINAGLGVGTNSSGSNVKEMSTSWGGNDGLNLGATYTDASGNAGANVTINLSPFGQETAVPGLQTQFWGQGPWGAPFYVWDADVWVKPFSMLKVKVGILDGGGPNITGPAGWAYGSDTAMPGIELTLTPIDGLTLQYIMPVDQYKGAYVTTPTFTFNAGAWASFNDDLNNSMFGFAYEMKDVFHFNAGIQLQSGGGSQLMGMSYDPTDENTTLFWGVDVKAVKNVTLQLESYIPLSTGVAGQDVEFWEKIAYTMGGWTFGITLNQDDYPNSVGLAVGFFPWVNYAISDAVAVGIQVNVYSYNDNSTINYDSQGVMHANQFNLYGNAPTSKDIGDMAGGGGPYITFTQGKGALTIGDQYFALPASAVQGGSYQNVFYINLSLNM